MDDLISCSQCELVSHHPKSNHGSQAGMLLLLLSRIYNMDKLYKKDSFLYHKALVIKFHLLFNSTFAVVDLGFQKRVSVLLRSVS